MPSQGVPAQAPAPPFHSRVLRGAGSIAVTQPNHRRRTLPHTTAERRRSFARPLTLPTAGHDRRASAECLRRDSSCHVAHWHMDGQKNSRLACDHFVMFLRLRTWEGKERHHGSVGKLSSKWLRFEAANLLIDIQRRSEGLVTIRLELKFV